MTDVMTPEQRRKNMQSIRSVSKLENIVSQQLWKKGFRFRKNTKDLFGKPDISIKKYKVVIFIDSCFFHQCPYHGNMPSTNTEFWRKKLNRNSERDKEVNDYYKQRNWNILRIWEHEVKYDLEHVTNKIILFIKEAKSKEAKA